MIFATGLQLTSVQVLIHPTQNVKLFVRGGRESHACPTSKGEIGSRQHFPHVFTWFELKEVCRQCTSWKLSNWSAGINFLKWIYFLHCTIFESPEQEETFIHYC
jgi:hypothetical protein